MRLLHACPPSCKRPPVDLTNSEPARERLRALKTIDLSWFGLYPIARSEAVATRVCPYKLKRLGSPSNSAR